MRLKIRDCENSGLKHRKLLRLLNANLDYRMIYPEMELVFFPNAAERLGILRTIKTKPYSSCGYTHLGFGASRRVNGLGLVQLRFHVTLGDAVTP